MPTIYRHHFPCTITPENPHGKGYTGYTYKTIKERDKQRFSPSHSKDSVGLKRAIVEHGKEKMQTDIIESDIPPIHELVIEREIYWIAYFDDFHNGYNWTEGGDGLTPEASREIQRKLVEDGTHHFLGGDIQRKQVEDGTHPFLDSEFIESQRKNNREIQRKLVEDGTHLFLDSEFIESQRKIKSKANRKRIENGTHHLLRKNHHQARPEYYQVYWEFILMYPLGIKETRKHLREKFPDIPRETRNSWIRKWHAELESE